MTAIQTMSLRDGNGQTIITWAGRVTHERMVLGGSMWKFQRKWLFLPLALSLRLSADSASQAEGIYQISESELTEVSQQWM